MQRCLEAGSFLVSAALACACSSRAPGGFAGTEDGGAHDAADFQTGDGASAYRGPTEVYGHSDDKLYRVDTITKAVTEVGTFTGCTHIADIAVDADSNLYASTGTEMYLVATQNARCTKLAAGTFPNSLSFVPRGTLDPSAEVLVGYQGADYVRIDTQTWQTQKVGSLTGGFVSSGDLVSVKDGGTYLTAKGPGCADCLLEIDPKTGDLKKNWGAIGKEDVFGIAFWGGAVYGFSNDGSIFELGLAQDKVVRTDIPIPNKPAGLSFWGAGSTTTAPLTPPK